MSLVLQPFLPFPHGCQGPSPHQQGRDARMIEQCFGGIDVSQDRLDVLLLPQGTAFSVANDEAGWSTLIGRLRGLPLTAIGLEPSGGYERGVLRALLAASLSVRRIYPNRLRQFARARGALAKNDRLDARLIAEYVATMPTHVVRHDPAAARIGEIVTVRRQLRDEHVAVGNQAAQLEDAMLRRLAKRRLARSRQGASRRRGRTSPRSSPRRTGMRAGRSNSRRRSPLMTAPPASIWLCPPSGIKTTSALTGAMA